MFSFLSPYKLLIEVAIIGALVLAIVVGIHKFLDYEQQIGYDKRDATAVKELAAAQAKAISDTVLLNKQLEDANNAAKQREQTIQAAANVAAASNASLRDALSRIRSGLPGASSGAVADTTITLANVFGECVQRYIGMAEIAQRHASDLQRFQESWPKVK